MDGRQGEAVVGDRGAEGVASFDDSNLEKNKTIIPFVNRDIAIFCLKLELGAPVVVERI